jgi:LPS export ABC transporter protein LptC
MKEKSFLVLSIILILGILIILGYKEDSINISPSYRTSSMRGIHLNHREGNDLKWELLADTATFPEDKKEIIIDSLELKILNEPGIKITGGKGIYDINSKDLSVRDRIKIFLSNGIFRTDSLKWKSSENIITTANNVEFTNDNFTIKGTGLIAEVREERVRILKNVTGIFYR